MRERINKKGFFLPEQKKERRMKVRKRTRMGIPIKEEEQDMGTAVRVPMRPENWREIVLKAYQKGGE